MVLEWKVEQLKILRVMTDMVSVEHRSRIMAKIRSKDTSPEIIIRHRLHRLGFRFRLHDKKLPGKPDLVLKKFNAVVFINGCFWHGHADCPLFRYPKSKQEYWIQKINRNRERDILSIEQLIKNNWRVLTVWECALKGKSRITIDSVINQSADWINGKLQTGEIRGGKIYVNTFR